MLILSTPRFQKYWQSKSNGTTNRQRVNEADFMNCKIPFPSINEQIYFVEKYQTTIDAAYACEKEIKVLEENIEKYLYDSLGIIAKQQETQDITSILKPVHFKEIVQWGYDKNVISFPYIFDKYIAYSFANMPKWYLSITRGKSPVYSEKGDKYILNQKCNRWDEIDLTFVKTVDPSWFERIDGKFFTQLNDCLLYTSISPLSFYQVNPVQTRKLYGQALEYAGLTGEETVWDLYCGIGTISLFLAQKAKKVYGVEIVPEAIADAKENAVRNGITNAEFYVGKAEEVLPRKYEEDGVYADVIVVDPPRKGCDEKCLETMVRMRPGRIVYVSCDSATLGRDLKYLGENGYEAVSYTHLSVWQTRVVAPTQPTQVQEDVLEMLYDAAFLSPKYLYEKPDAAYVESVGKARKAIEEKRRQKEE